MNRVNGIKKLTNNPFLNLYELDAQFRDGSRAPYYVASRRKNIEAAAHSSQADGAVLYGVYGEDKDKLVLIRQFRYPINDYVYELPSGLIDPGETPQEAGIREMFEETGLIFHPVNGGSFCRPFYTSVGMTDESCATIYGYCEGIPTNRNQEGTEDIQVVLADRAECRRILKEEQVAIMCAYQLMHFIASEGDPLAFLKNAK